MKCFKDFLAPTYEMNILSNGQYAILLNQCLVYESLKTHCQESINRMINSSFTAPESKDVARAMMIKLEIYHEHLTELLTMLALAFYLTVPKTDEEI